MLRIKFGDREWRLNEAAALTMGDVVALREMGIEPDRFGLLLGRVAGARTPGQVSGVDALELAHAAAQLAYIAAVREDHHLRWRDFVWSIPIDDLQAFDIDSEDDAEDASAAPAGEVGAALAEAGAAAPQPSKKTRRSRAKAS